VVVKEVATGQGDPECPSLAALWRHERALEEVPEQLVALEIDGRRWVVRCGDTPLVMLHGCWMNDKPQSAQIPAGPRGVTSEVPSSSGPTVMSAVLMRSRTIPHARETEASGARSHIWMQSLMGLRVMVTAACCRVSIFSSSSRRVTC